MIDKQNGICCYLFIWKNIFCSIQVFKTFIRVCMFDFTLEWDKIDFFLRVYNVKLIFDILNVLKWN